jgi:hypothetical protein
MNDSAPAQSALNEKQFIFVKIPEDIMPIARGEKYEDPINAFLKKNNVGEVSGGGTMQSKPDANGHRRILYVGVDVDLTNFEQGLPLLKNELVKVGAPPGTVLQYTRNGKDYEETVP